MYEEAKRAVEQQLPVLDGIRTRSVTAFSAGSIAIAFLAGRALDAADQSCASLVFLVLAILAYVAALAFAFATLLPVTLETTMKVSVLQGDDWRTQDNAGMYEHLASYTEGQYSRNETKVNLRWNLSVAAISAIGVSVVMMLLAVVLE